MTKTRFLTAHGVLLRHAIIPGLALLVNRGTALAVDGVEKYLSTEGIGEEILHEKEPVELSADEARKMFDGSDTHLGAQWMDGLKGKEIRETAGAAALPAGLGEIYRPPGENDVKLRARVVRFSKEHVVIRIGHPAGSYLWHHYFDTTAVVMAPRTKELEEAFKIGSLEKGVGGTYKGVGQGDVWKVAVKTLGEPEKVEGTQAEEYWTAEYEGGKVRVEVWRGRVWRVTGEEK